MTSAVACFVQRIHGSQCMHDSQWWGTTPFTARAVEADMMKSASPLQHEQKSTRSRREFLRTAAVQRPDTH